LEGDSHFPLPLFSAWEPFCIYFSVMTSSNFTYPDVERL
jgi:hypothetical protein